MKLFIRDGIILTTARDESDDNVPDCEVRYVPDSTRRHRDDGVPMKWNELGISDDEVERYEAQVKLRLSDAEMARVGEDIINLLIGKGIIEAKDLPSAVRVKIENRKTWRKKMRRK